MVSKIKAVLIIALVCVLLCGCVNPNIAEDMQKNSVVIFSGDSIGSGFFIASGVILTASHVVGETATIEMSDLSRYEMVDVLYRNAELDYAIISIDRHTTFVKTSKKLKTGDKVFTYSAPIGVRDIMTEGIVSNGSKIIDGKELFMFTAPISAGSSGGAVINQNGEVIGVIISIMDGHDMNIAIPMDKIIW